MTAAGRNPYSRDHRSAPAPRRLAVLFGGLLFALGVFTFLAWIQPDTSGERVSTPVFRPAFKVERDPPPKTQTPQRERRQRPPPKPREQKAQPKKVARTARPRAAPRPSAARAPRSAAPTISGVTNLLGAGAGGGVGLSIGGSDLSAALDEVAVVHERERMADEIRERNFAEDDAAEAESRRTPGVAKEARLTVRPVPRYPAEARQRNIEGVVRFRALVEVDGRIDESTVELLEAQPPGYFESTLLEEVIPKMVYDPALDAEGNPIPAWTITIYEFELVD